MPRVLLVSLNRETVPYPVFPIGVWVLHHYLARHGVESEVADLYLLSDVAGKRQVDLPLTPAHSLGERENRCLSGDSQAARILAGQSSRSALPPAEGKSGGAIPQTPLDTGLDALEEQFLRRRSYDFVGLSLRNIDNLSWPASADFCAEAVACVERVKRYVEKERIILGGAGYSIFGEELLQTFGLQRGVAGDGEQALLRWVNGPATSLSPPDFSFARRVPADVLRHYYRESGMIGLQTRRGCPFDCSYCTYPQIEGRAMRSRDASGVLAEIRLLQEQHGIGVFYFVDCNFNYPSDYTRTLLQSLAAANLGIRWYAFVNPGYFDADLARRMKSAGCGGVEFGSESGDPLVLRLFNKNYGPDQLLVASRACQEAGLKFCHYLLLGAPGETRESVAATLALMQECEPSTVILSVGLRVYPGTGIARELVQQGKLDPRQSLLAPTFYEPERIALPEIQEYCHAHAPAHWILPGRGDQQMAEQMKRLRRGGARGPLWDYL